MTVYNNQGSKPASEILRTHDEDLRTDSWRLFYEPESDTSIELLNAFDIPCLNVVTSGEDTRTVYAPAEEIDDRLANLVTETFGSGFEEKPYAEYLWLSRQKSDEETTRKEVLKFVRTAHKRSLSAEFKMWIRAQVALI